MSIEGRIAVDASFADKTDGTNVQSLKKIQLTDTDAYTTGKVAVLTGTCGTDFVTLVNDGVTTYKDSSGSAVTFQSLARCVASNAGTHVIVYDTLNTVIAQNGNLVVFQPLLKTITVNTFSGTASYTVVLYGT